MNSRVYGEHNWRNTTQKWYDI